MREHLLIALGAFIALIGLAVAGAFAFSFVYLFATQPAMWVVLGGLLVFGPACDWLLGGTGRL